MGAADSFAEQMRGLKERSGLSYGALAKRLHVSTSTLHRYCNGDAVPAEFAPVERLGRLCGATREELIELHRCWILADEVRRRGKTADGREPGPEAPAVAEPEVPAVAEPEAAPVAAASEAPAAADEAADSESGGGDGPLLTAQEPPARRRHRKRLGAVLAALAVVALAVPVAYVVRATDAASNSAEDGREGRDGKGSAAESAADAPLSVGISSYNWAAPCGQYFLLDQGPGHVPPPPPPQDTRSWGRTLDGVDGGHMRLQLTVTGRTRSPVVLSGLHLRVQKREAPLDRPAYSMGDGCGSGITPQTFDVDLDAPRPFVKAVAGQDGDLVVPAKDFPYQVATGDAQVLNLDVHTEGHDVTWYLELDWSTGDRKGRIRVDDGGEPFRTSAIEGRPTYGYWPGKGTWVKQ